ncbi:MAG: entericidin A/B family lipoprotein [Paracoccaceae bacterium]
MLNKVALGLSLMFLAACQTAEGFGRDVQTGGQVIEDAANEVEDEI